MPYDFPGLGTNPTTATPCPAPTHCTRCGTELSAGGRVCLACGMPQVKDAEAAPPSPLPDHLTEFCREIDCVFRRLMDDEEYLPAGSKAEKIATLQKACWSCEAWRYNRFLKGRLVEK